MDLNRPGQRGLRRLTRGGLLALIFAVGAPRLDAAEPPGPAEAGAAVRAALGREGFPWYDAERDRVRVLRFRPEPDPPSPASPSSGGGTTGGSWNWNFGDIVVFLASALALGALVGVVAWTWRRFERPPGGPATEPRPGRSVTVEALPLLPLDLRVAASDDPWAEAVRRRASGDLAGAVVCVFVHQVLVASRLDLVRLAPDRTPRQIQRGVRDPEFRALMVPSLRQFEVVFYGHRDPEPAAFAAFWESAEAFQRLLAQPRRLEGGAR